MKNEELKSTSGDSIMPNNEDKDSESVSFATDEEVAALGSAIIEENREAFEELAK